MPSIISQTMDSDQIDNLALELEGEELAGSGNRSLSADDIAPVIEALWERGADFSGLVSESVELSSDDSDGIEEVLEN